MLMRKGCSYQWRRRGTVVTDVPRARSESPVDGLTAEAIRAARLDAGWSFTQAARELKRHSQQPLPAVDSIVRSWKRWEKGTAPSRQYQPLLRRMLGVGMGVDPSAGNGAGDPSTPDLSGQWYAAWQTWKGGIERVAV